jgi:endogenous inhibitor of DNA gyrase (YacG/DUF329 family)
MSHVTQISPPPAPVAHIPNRLRQWHPRFHLCAVCIRPAAGFGYADPHSNIHPRTYRWFCSKHCQALFAHKARKGMKMIDLTEEEHAAATATMKRMGALMGEFGWETRLSDLTADEVRALIEEAVDGFREAMAATAQSYTAEVPF